MRRNLERKFEVLLLDQDQTTSVVSLVTLNNFLRIARLHAGDVSF
jgi:hypothetical protein